MALAQRIARWIMAAESQAPAPAFYEPPPLVHEVDIVLAHEHPAMAMWGLRYEMPGRGKRMLHLGWDDVQWMCTEPQGHALVLGPPRSKAGKTASVIIPTILSSYGQVVATSTKDDVLRATAFARAPSGRVWVYAPDGGTPLPPGVHQLRWSPIGQAGDWATAVRTARDMTKALVTERQTDGDHWKERAADTLAPVFHWACLKGAPMRVARDMIYQLCTPVPGGKILIGEQIVNDLRSDRRADPAAAAVLASVMAASDRERASILSTAVRALQVYQLPGAVASTDEPNFEPAAFVRGDYGHSTVYIISSNENQDLCAPLVVGLLNQIRQEQYKAHRRRTHAEMSGAAWNDATNPDVANRLVDEETRGIGGVTFVLDEIFGIAPIPDLANMLSEGGSQGVQVCAAVQDLALIKERWKTAGESFLTLFGDVLVFPGIRHGDTLEIVSKLIGEYDREVPGTSSQYGPQSSYTESTSIKRERIMPPDVVSRGADPANPDLVVHLSPRGPSLLSATPYWRAAPWPQILTDLIEWSLEKPVSAWPQRLGRSEPEPLRTALPIPDLTAWATAELHRDPWAARYLEAKQRWERGA
jgi:type IV secretory pathway TraG/TraD family ATPase VirD4